MITKKFGSLMRIHITNITLTEKYSGNIFIFVLLVLSVIHTSESQSAHKYSYHIGKQHKCPCSQNYGREMKEKNYEPKQIPPNYGDSNVEEDTSVIKFEEPALNLIPFNQSKKIKNNDQRQPVISRFLTEKILSWLNKINKKLKAIGNSEQRDGVSMYPKITTQKFDYSFPTNNNDLNKISMRRHHFATGKYNIPSHKNDNNISAHPKALKDKEIEHRIPFNDDSVMIDERLKVIPLSPQIIPNMGSEYNTFFKYNPEKIFPQPDSITQSPESTPEELNLNSPDIFEVIKHSILAKINPNVKSKLNLASYYDTNRLNKHQNEIPTHVSKQNSYGEDIKYNNEKITKEADSKPPLAIPRENSVPLNIDTTNLAKHEHKIHPKIITNEESQFNVLFHGNINNFNEDQANSKASVDEESKHNIPSIYETNKFAEQPDRVPFYQPDGKFKYIKLQNEMIPALYTNDIFHGPPSADQGQETFNTWILEQIKTLNFHQNKKPEEIDLIDFRNSILDILKKNGMYITATGMLIDSHGIVLDIHTLNLIPILIQNTASLGKLFERNGRVLYNQIHLPYLEAILVTTTNPSKVLGVLLLEKLDLPLSSNKANAQYMNSETGKYKVEELQNENYLSDNELNQPITNSLDKVDKENTDEEKIGIPSMRGAPDVLISDPFSKMLVSDQGETESGRLIFPNFEQGLEILSRGRDIPLTSTKEYRNSKNINLPSMIQKLMEVFGKRNVIETEDTQSNMTVEIPKTFITSKVVPIPSVFRKESDAIPTLKKQSLMDMMPRSKEFYKSLGKLIGNNRRLESNSPFSDSLEIVNLPSMHSVSLSKDLPKIVSINAMPLESLERSRVITQMQDTDFISPSASDMLSRSGTLAPEIPPENGSDSIQVPGVLVEAEDEDDDDDGDFRIIGGNAATGSGTPLSNRGRSGRF